MLCSTECRRCPRAGISTSPRIGKTTWWSPRFATRALVFRTNVQDKIFELYFTTKKDGSGIGLGADLSDSAMALRFGGLRVLGWQRHHLPPASTSKRESRAIFQRRKRASRDVGSGRPSADLTPMHVPPQEFRIGPVDRSVWRSYRRDMTLAVIVGLWGLLFPGFATGENTVLRHPVGLQAADQTQENPGPPQSGPQATPPQQDAQKTEAAPTATPAKPKRHVYKKKPAQPSDPPAKVVVRDGSTEEPAVKLSPSMSPNQSSNQLKNADALLADTESNLKQISGRTLNPAQQETVKQIHSYMDQARKAIGDGDPDRGRNLAFKAHLLSMDLVKH